MWSITELKRNKEGAVTHFNLKGEVSLKPLYEHSNLKLIYAMNTYINNEDRKNINSLIIP